MADRSQVRLVITVPGPMRSNNRHAIFHDTYKIYGVSLFCLLFSKIHKSSRSEIGFGIYFQIII